VPLVSPTTLLLHPKVVLLTALPPHRRPTSCQVDNLSTSCAPAAKKPDVLLLRGYWQLADMSLRIARVPMMLKVYLLAIPGCSAV
jgi:hypothetical protein